jgi:ArsR family transcriptional regulator
MRTAPLDHIRFGGYDGRVPRTQSLPPVQRFAALSDATRLRLLQLMRAGEICVCDLVDGVDAPQPTVSRHLAVLRRSGLVNVRREGAWNHYSLAAPGDELHRRLLDCLDACSELSAEFEADQRRVQRARRARSCCD